MMTGQHHQDEASRSFEGPYDGPGDDLFEGRSTAPHAAGREVSDSEAGPDDLFWNRSPHTAGHTGPERTGPERTGPERTGPGGPGPGGPGEDDGDEER